MPIQLTCPSCGTKLQVPSKLVRSGQAVKCPQCSTVIAMPAQAAPIPSAPSDPRWYAARNGKRQGPFTYTQIQQLARAGKLQPTDMLWQEGTTTWVPADSIRGLFPGAIPIVETGTTAFPAGDQSALIPCRACQQPIAADAAKCPRCGSPNNWVHPEISRFMESVDRFKHLRGFKYVYHGYQLKGWAWDMTQAKLAGRSGAVLLLGSLVLFLLGPCSGVFAIAVIGYFLGPLCLLAGILLLVLSFVKTDSVLTEFVIDFSESPPKWSSNNELVWQDVKAFFNLASRRPRHRKNTMAVTVTLIGLGAMLVTVLLCVGVFWIGPSSNTSPNGSASSALRDQEAKVSALRSRVENLRDDLRSTEGWLDDALRRKAIEGDAKSVQIWVSRLDLLSTEVNKLQRELDGVKKEIAKIDTQATARQTGDADAIRNLDRTLGQLSSELAAIHDDLQRDRGKAEREQK